MRDEDLVTHGCLGAVNYLLIPPDHVTPCCVKTKGPGRTIAEWKTCAGNTKNHWLDCLVGCTAAASICGVKAPGQDAGSGRQRERCTQDDLRKR